MLATSALGARSYATKQTAETTTASQEEVSSEYVSEDNNVVESLGDVVNGKLITIIGCVSV